MNLSGAAILLAGTLVCGVVFGLVLSLMAWRTQPSYAQALRIGMKLGLSVCLAFVLCLVLQGLYENWASA